MGPSLCRSLFTAGLPTIPIDKGRCDGRTDRQKGQADNVMQHTEVSMDLFFSSPLKLNLFARDLNGRVCTAAYTDSPDICRGGLGLTGYCMQYDRPKGVVSVRSAHEKDINGSYLEESIPLVQKRLSVSATARQKDNNHNPHSWIVLKLQLTQQKQNTKQTTHTHDGSTVLQGTSSSGYLYASIQVQRCSICVHHLGCHQFC